MIEWKKIDETLPCGHNLDCLIKTTKFGILQAIWNITGTANWWYAKSLGTFHIKDVTHWVECEGLLPKIRGEK